MASRSRQVLFEDYATELLCVAAAHGQEGSRGSAFMTS